MDLSYYPGCTLKTKAKGLDDSAIASMDALGIKLVEIDRWNCCGTVYSLAEDDLAHHLAPVRNLIRVKEQGSDRVGTLCSFCYHTLKRANLLMRNDGEKRKTLNDFMEEEVDYNGEVEVVHLLEVLRDDVGWENIAAKVRVPLQGLKVAPYYGCTLLRPKEVAIDQVERPTILSKLMETLGAEAVDQIVGNPDFITQCAWEILSSALRRGAEALVLTCPLCHFNLSQRQSELMQRYSDFQGLPILYFSQLLAIALGIEPKVCHFELDSVDSLSLLKSKNLVS